MRDSLVLYTSYYDKFKKLSDEQFGKLIRLVFQYQEDGIVPEIEDIVISIAFDVIRHDLDINNAKYEMIIQKRKEAGSAGGKARADNFKQMVANVANAKSAKQNEQDQASQADTVTDTVTDTVNIKESVKEKPRTQKHKYGSFNKVLLTDEEYTKLTSEYGEDKTTAAIQFLDEYIAEKDYKSKSHYLAIRRWVMKAVEERKTKKQDNRLGAFGNYKQTSTDDEWDELTSLALKEVNGL